MRELLQEYLTEQGYTVSVAADGDAMWHHLSENPVDLVILDVVMPGDDGLTLARELQGRDGLGIIMVSGQGEAVDRVAGLEIGADDYLVKPVVLRELLARVRSVLRRTPSEAPRHKARTALFDRWIFDTEARTLQLAEGDEVALTTGEFILLSALVEQTGEALGRDQLQGLLQGREWGHEDRGVDVQIGWLRRKIEVDSRRPKLIQTIRTVGYRFTAPVTWR